MYDELYQDSLGNKKTNLSLIGKLKIVEKEKNALKLEVSESTALVAQLKKDRTSPLEKVHVLEKEVHTQVENKKSLEDKIEKDLIKSNDALQKMSDSSEKLDKMLSVGKST